MELLKIGKRTYAAGLDAWLSVETHTKAVKVARKKAKSLKFAVFALRPSPVPQIGLLKEFPKGRLKGQVYSLAAAVAGAQPESWSGLFALPSGKWWVLSIFNGVIVSNGDLLTDEPTARAQFDKELSRLPGDIQPVEISDPDESVRWLTKNAGNKYPTILRKTQDNSILMAGGALLGAAAIGGGFWWYHEQTIAAKRKADHLALLRMLAAEKKHQEQVQSKANVAKAVPPPWTGKPDYTTWSKAVKTLAASLPLAERGWSLSDISCGQVACSATWRRGFGVTVLDAPQGDMAANGDVVTTNYPLSFNGDSSRGAIIDVATPVSGTDRWLQGWIQSLGVNGNVQSPTVGMMGGYPIPGHTTIGASGKLPPAPTWTTKTFSLSLPVPPWRATALNLPGLVVNSVTWRPGGNWHLTGALYGPAH